MSNDTETLTLTDFLLARIVDDEEIARRALMLRDQGETPDDEPWRYWWQDVPSRLCIDPTRILAECETKRRIVEIHTGNHECASLADSCEWIADGAVCETLRYLTLPYADHPDCRDDWRP